ncbi:hypothetical protein [Micromonospora zamorensis]|uniref:hypothetical protein n=1 Tax=Micromonospora zamorensis TaxID=709883 RepID=UPI00081FD6E3|nr:hypothetical protein [Micromonospora zamorensis]SCG41316.1 hypothetical protein GA0070619_1092 [Micromonospora zamorensis]
MDDLDDITGGDEERTHDFRRLLEQLAQSKNPLLREMATAVQDGHLALRQAATSTTYGTELAAPVQTFRNACQKLSPEERDNLASRARQQG